MYFQFLDDVLVMLELKPEIPQFLLNLDEHVHELVRILIELNMLLLLVPNELFLK